VVDKKSEKEERIMVLLYWDYFFNGAFFKLIEPYTATFIIFLSLRIV